MIPGYATPEATAAFAARHVKDEGAATGHYRTARGLSVSSIGLGTYLGDPDAETDGAYEEAIIEFVRAGGNFIDTAINYRAQRSERSIGRALVRAIDDGLARRESLVICTKGGYFPFDDRYPRSQRESKEWIQKQLIDPGIINLNDIAGGCHSMSPRYIEHQVEWSRRNLQLETIDVYYLHNPETWLSDTNADRESFMNKVRAAFETLEKLAATGAIRYYGMATWNGFRVPGTADEYLSLEECIQIARSIAGDGHRFRFIQAPFNLAMLEAVRFANQRAGSRLVPLFEAAKALDICAVASATIYQGKLAEGLPPQIAELFPGLSTDAQRAIQFNRSAPNITVTLVGMGNRIHVLENCNVAKRPPAPVEITKKLLLKLA